MNILLDLLFFGVGVGAGMWAQRAIQRQRDQIPDMFPTEVSQEEQDRVVMDRLLEFIRVAEEEEDRE